MAFTVSDLGDFLKLLREHPEWRAEVRREVLGDELLALPDLVRENSEAIRDLQAIVRQNSVDIRDLREVVQEHGRTLERILDAISRLEASVQQLVTLTGQHTGDINEMKWARLATGRFGKRLRRLKVRTASDLELFEAADDAGIISEVEALAVRRLDLIVEGVEGRGADARPAMLAVEISASVEAGDVERAAMRAAVLRQVGYNAYPAVAGARMDARVRSIAEGSGVEVFLESEVLAG
ncbi:MAG: hypothetical protein IT302_11845 [Dehalococcoidia bacterium]|nr:hypothetical protein [Dehalococcoidia bacterium]